MGAPWLPAGRIFRFEYLRPPDRHATFESHLLHADERTIVLWHALHPRVPIDVMGRPVLRDGDIGVWFLLNGAPYDVARVYDPEGGFKGYYVDILSPVHWAGNDPESLQPLIDLFLDVWIDPSGTHTVLDEDEFHEAAEAGWMTRDQEAAALHALDRVVGAVKTGEFPPAVVREFTVERET